MLLTEEIINSNMGVRVLLRLEELCDVVTYEHSLGVARLTEQLIPIFEKKYKTKFSKAFKKEVITGALLHDIGKVYVPLNLVTSNKRYASEEKTIVSTHTSIGACIVDGTFSRIIKDIIMYHHSPNKYYSDIPFMTSVVYIINVADRFNAMTTNRPYKKAHSDDWAIDRLKEERTPNTYLELLLIYLNK